MLEPVTHRLHVLIVFLWRGDVGVGDVCVLRDTAGAVVRQSVSRPAAVDDTFTGQTSDVRDTGQGRTVLADPRVGRQGEHASAT